MADTKFTRRGVVLGAAAVGLSACASKPKISTYGGPKVTRVVVQKADRKMYLFSGTTMLESYDIELGFAPEGHKTVYGDGKTPEGSYYIDRRNPRSSFYLSLGISYPNAQDRMEAARLGKQPGGDIFIHGQRRPGDPKGPDWTAGCIAVKNKEMSEIYAMVQTGTRIDINP
ncbi:L,D-transpeptidase family protein [Alphaproteobacteria bacterium KMM 3653]|uniref:L,D-transpeptidase family protein n=1 Tax=Harenicola maris TaxID=2841044 RepID=A0AAP2G3W7_9RHOB|nr:L,D-transpeptidase family protein [Harenicola maris]